MNKHKNVFERHAEMLAEHRDELFEQIKEFLSVYKHSDFYSHPEVTQDELSGLFAIVARLISLKWDSSHGIGDAVQFKLVDRTSHEPLYFAALPYFGNDEANSSPEFMQKVLKTAMLNVEMATGKLAEVVRINKILEDQRVAKKKESDEAEKVIRSFVANCPERLAELCKEIKAQAKSKIDFHRKVD